MRFAGINLLAGALLAAGSALTAGSLDIASNFDDPGAYKEIPKKDFVSGSLPEGWRDESAWSKSNCVYSCEKDGSQSFLRVVCPPSADKTKIQFFHPMGEFAERKAFKVTLKARSQSKSEMRFMIQAMGTPKSYASATVRLEEGWKDFTATLAGGPTDTKNVGFIIYTPGPASSVDIASVKLEEMPLSEYVPKTCVPSTRAAEWKDWMTYFQRDAKALSEQKPDFMIMGDSITAAWSAQGKEAWEKYIAPFNATRFGIAGDRVENLLWRVENSSFGKDCKPKLVAILIGVNNLFLSDADDIAAGMKNLVAKIQKLSPETKVLILGVFPVGAKADDVRRKLIKDVNANYEKLADGKSVFFLDFGDSFLEPDGTISKETFFDYVHCTPKSYMLYGEKLSAKAKEIMGK